MSDEHKQMRIDAGLVRELAELLATNELSEIEVEKGDLRIRVARNPATAVTVPVVAPAPAPASGSSALPAIGTAGPASLEDRKRNESAAGDQRSDLRGRQGGSSSEWKRVGREEAPEETIFQLRDAALSKFFGTEG